MSQMLNIMSVGVLRASFELSIMMMVVIDISVQCVWMLSCCHFNSGAQSACMVEDRGPVSMIAHVEAPSVASGKQGQRDDLDWTDQQGCCIQRGGGLMSRGGLN